MPIGKVGSTVLWADLNINVLNQVQVLTFNCQRDDYPIKQTVPKVGFPPPFFSSTVNLPLNTAMKQFIK